MRLLIVLTVLVLAISVGTYYLVEEPGYLFVQWGPWQVEMSLTLIAGVAIAVFLAAYLIYSFAAGVIRFPGKIRSAYRNRASKKNQIQSVKGYIHLVQGDWDKAEKHLTTTASRTSEPVIDYLAAAYSAQQRGDIAQRDRLLDQADGGSIGSRTVIDLVRSKLQIDEGRIDEAVKNLNSVRTLIPGSKAALRLLAEAYVKDSRWSDLYDLIPSLRKHQVLASKEIGSMFRQACRHKFESAETAAQLLGVWKQVPAAGKQNPEIIGAYANRLLEYDRHQEAEKVLRRALEGSWDSRLAYVYGFIDGKVDIRQIYRRAVGWLTEHPDDADLLLTCGKLAARSGQWAKAREHLGACIEHSGREEASVELARILEDQGDFQGAFDAYKRGAVQLSQQRSRAKPQPANI